ncbi:MAG TPA: carboxypeptidase-like regulatory domain-containing protein, partial [Candidatus Norongarragalinales archaeon]|nr:carboxypeptidase-like regulatory domain-containing protein [Candidatus Norongarragalinales archaeon]
MLEGLREWWENFSYSLEEKGIPPWVLPLALVVILAIGYLLLFPSSPSGNVSISVKNDLGEAISGATVTLSGENFEETAVSDESGIASFSKVPEGAYTAIVSSPEHVFDNGGLLSLSVSPGQDSSSTAYSQPPSIQLLSLSVLVQGPAAANIELLDKDELPVDAPKAGVTTALFKVRPNQAYLIRVTADGFSAETKSVSVGASDPALQRITLLPFGVEKKGVLFIGV